MTEIKKTVRLIFLDSYLTAIKNSVGANIFKTLWAEVDGQTEDILEGGKLSCASFVSGILAWFGLIKERHATVAGTVRDMQASGWEVIPEPRPGCVLHWEKMKENGEHEHLGFYLGHDAAVSNSRTARTPIEHHWTYDGGRRVVAIYWHPRLNS
ncbi:MAG: hypothetical protein HYU81_00595 [Candidatus Brennerbacteria bacterium]|nr:hypothetical protein [Candidatus Brennerbacteria bacterium]